MAARVRGPIDRVRDSLAGLSVGDAFGEAFFLGDDALAARMIADRLLPTGQWGWTDDTAMAISVARELAAGSFNVDGLARRYASAYAQQPRRGYGGAAHTTLQAIDRGVPWRIASRSVYPEGSKGNGSAMRSAPIGAFHGWDPKAIARDARVAALPTHAHPEAIDGSIAIALAAGYAAEAPACGRGDLLSAVVGALPDGSIAQATGRALELLGAKPEEAADALGSGQRVLCVDTVPFAIWCADRHIDDFEAALWATVAGLGDRDTTCAMVGGIVGARVGVTGIPPEWLERREPIPAI